MAKKVYKINERNIVEYKTNQKDAIFAGAPLNKDGYPNYWPTRNENNALVFISFVDARIEDLNGSPVYDNKTTFDILDQDTFNSKDPDAETKVLFISSLLSPKYKVVGGVYVNGHYYTGQMKPKYATKLYKSFMDKYFFVEDKEIIESKFARDKEGFFPYWPIKTKEKNARIMFSAVNARIINKVSKEIVKDNINFNIKMGYKLDLNDKQDRLIADTLFAIEDPTMLVEGFYYKGNLIPHVISPKMKRYLEKGIIKKNFTIEQVPYLLEHASTNKQGQLYFYPMADENGHEIVVSFRDGITPFGEKFNDFDITSSVHFNPRLEANQFKLQIIERIIEKNPAFKGTLYIDGVLVPGKEKKSEIERRIGKVEKALRCRIDGDLDFIKISNNFSTDDREKLLALCEYYHETYPGLTGPVPRKLEGFNPKIKKDIFVFDNVNILEENGKLKFKKNYSARYDGPFKPNEKEMEILKEAVKKYSTVRGGIYFNGKNFNRDVRLYHHPKLIKFISKSIGFKEYTILAKNARNYGNPYKIDKKSKMLVHWPCFDANGKEIILSTVDADIWFKVGHNIVKACNDINFNIYSGKTFGLVGESGSGKTTISRGILGINKLRKGGIYWKGKLISSGLNAHEIKANKKNIQMIFQDPAASLNERANIDYIVSEGLYSFHLAKNKEERLNKVTHMLREVGLLPEHLSRYPHEFSGGQRQRIGIARALVIEPELVLADEPISALDVSIRAQVLNLLKRLQKTQNLTYLFIAHDLSIIRYISDQIAVMHSGYVVELGEAEDIYQNPLHPYTKSLLTAIPQPDPKSKDTRKRVVYDQGNMKYKDCYWCEMQPGHFVLVNDELKARIEEEMKKQGN